MSAEVRTRRGLIRPLAVSLISSLAIVAILISGMPLAARLVLTATVAFAAWRGLRQAGTHAIKLDRGAAPSLDGVRGRLSGEAITSMFVALKLVAADGQVRRLLLFRDELRPDAFRALLVYLRHG